MTPRIWQPRGCDEQQAQALEHELGIASVTARLLCIRGLGEVDVARRFLSPVLEDLHDHGAILSLEVHRAAAWRGDVGLLLDVDHEMAGGAAGGAGHAAVEAVQHDGAAAAGQAHLLRHLGDDADRRVLRLVARDEEDALGVADLERQRDGHGGEDDCLFERDQS